MAKETQKRQGQKDGYPHIVDNIINKCIFALDIGFRFFYKSFQ